MQTWHHFMVLLTWPQQSMDLYPGSPERGRRGNHIPQMAGVGHQQRGLFALLHGLYDIMPEAPRNILIPQQKASAGSLSLFQLWLLAVARVTEHWRGPKAKRAAREGKANSTDSPETGVSLGITLWFCSLRQEQSPPPPTCFFPTWTLSTRLSPLWRSRHHGLFFVGFLHGTWEVGLSMHNQSTDNSWERTEGCPSNNPLSPRAPCENPHWGGW